MVAGSVRIITANGGGGKWKGYQNSSIVLIEMKDNNIPRFKHKQRLIIVKCHAAGDELLALESDIICIPCFLKNHTQVVGNSVCL